MSVPRGQRGGEARTSAGVAARPREPGKEEGRGKERRTREDGFLRRALPIVLSSLPCSLGGRSRRQGRRDAGARFYGSHDEDQGGAYVHRSDTPVRLAEGHARGGGTITIFALLPRAPAAAGREHNATPGRFARGHASPDSDGRAIARLDFSPVRIVRARNRSSEFSVLDSFFSQYFDTRQTLTRARTSERGGTALA